MTALPHAVFFDVGETLVSEARLWKAWADWLSVPHETFFAALEAVIERGEHHRRVFDILRPDLAPFDLKRARRDREAAGWSRDVVEAADFYPDALPCLARLRALGYRIGIAGNQPAQVETTLSGAGVPADVVASSERWGVEKPSPAFFHRISETANLPPSRIAYVGDRLDNDVLPALDAGFTAIFIRRGPWGLVHAARPEAKGAHGIIDSLDELPGTLRRLGL